MASESKHYGDVDYKKLLLGILGEKIIARYFRALGSTVEESLNIFDPEKDMIIDGNMVEVKANAPLIYHDSFSIPKSQYNKIINSYRVYWISVPLQKEEDIFEGCIFEMDPKIVKFHTITFKSGKTVIAVKRQQEGMKIIYKIKSKKLLEQLKNLSSSYL